MLFPVGAEGGYIPDGELQVSSLEALEVGILYSGSSCK